MSSTGDENSSTDSPSDESLSRSLSAVAGASTDSKIPTNALPTSNPESRLGQSPGAQDEDEDGFDEEDGDRENRFQGPDSTWRTHTEEERSLAASLDQQRSNDLSIHLYNTHALKARVRDPEAASEIKNHHGKKRWIKPNEDGSLPWHPPTAWTAWPLKPEDVPRKAEHFGAPALTLDEHHATYWRKEAWKPSADLEEEIQAVMLRKAKEHFREQNSARPSPKPNGMLASAEQTDSAERQSSISNADTDMSIDENERQVGSADKDVKITDIRHDQFTMRDILIDDDAATALLHPTVVEVLRKLNDLLVGLHKNREGHRRSSPQCRSKSRRSRSASFAKTPVKRKIKRINRTIETSEDDDSESGHSESSSELEDDTKDEQQHSKKPKRQRPLGPRDWSEVLGMASIIGWDPAIIDRAARRCASLFGESMTFNPTSYYTDILTNGPESTLLPSTQPKNVMIVVDESEVQQLSCSITTCRRRGEPFEKAWRWREHMKRSHKYSREQIEALETSL